MIGTAATLLLASLAAAEAGGTAAERLPVPSGDEVWLQETIEDRVPGLGIVSRYRFVMPSLAALVPPVPAGDVMADIPPELLDEPTPRSDAPLSADDRAAVSAALDQLAHDSAEAAPPDGAVAEGGEDEGSAGGGDDPGLPRLALPDGSDGGGLEPGPTPGDLAAPDAAPAQGSGDDGTLPQGGDAESAGDLAAAGQSGADGGDLAASGAGMALPAAPDTLMQDPVHRDIQWLCEHVALPKVAAAGPRPSQVVISLASAPSEFGSFDPEIVQLFEGFSIPSDRDACVWEPL